MGLITPASAGALTIALYEAIDGTIPRHPPIGPYLPVVTPPRISMLGYNWAGKNPMASSIAVGASAAQANTVVPVV